MASFCSIYTSILWPLSTQASEVTETHEGNLTHMYGLKNQPSHLCHLLLEVKKLTQCVFESLTQSPMVGAKARGAEWGSGHQNRTGIETQQRVCLCVCVCVKSWVGGKKPALNIVRRSSPNNPGQKRSNCSRFPVCEVYFYPEVFRMDTRAWTYCHGKSHFNRNLMNDDIPVY